MAEKIVRSCRKPKYCRILSETGTKTARILCCRFGPRLRDKPGRRLHVRMNSQPPYFFLTALLTARTAPNRTAAQGQMIQVRSHFMV